MTRTLLVRLITLGDPERLSGGYLYHRRLAQLAPEHGAELRFVSVPEWPFPLPALAGGAVLRRALGPVAAPAADVVVLDSIAAGFLGPWLALRRPPVPLVGSLHQPPGGIDHGRVRRAVQAPLDRLAYRRAALLLVASQALAEQVETAGLLASRIRVVPPGRDVAAAPGAPAGDLRAGRRAALLCVANWVERKGILETLEALARLDACAATLHLAGDDRADPRYAAAVRARLSRRDLAGRVVGHGPLPVEAIAALYQAADVFVLPSLREPYGTVWGEAMAAGLPVVGWRAGNLPYLADEREAAPHLAGNRRQLLRLAPRGGRGRAALTTVPAVPAAMRALRCRAPSGVGEPDLHLSLADAGQVGGLRRGRRAVQDRPVLEAEGAPVAGAHDPVLAREVALVQRAAAVRAPVGERVDGRAAPEQQHLDRADHRGRGLVLAQLLGGDRRLPVGRRLLESVLVHPDAQAEREVAAEVGRGVGHPEAGRRQPPATHPPPALAGQR